MSFDECAARGCHREVKATMLMCSEHWFQVPKEIRDRIWRQFARKQRGVAGASREHYRACVDAIQSLGAVPEEPVVPEGVHE